MTTNAHASEDDLELYAVRKLIGPALDHLEDHLMVCQGCRNRLEEMDDYVSTMRAGLRRANAADPYNVVTICTGFARDWRLLSAAGAFAALLAVVALPSMLTRVTRPTLYSDVTLESARGLESVARVPAGAGAVIRLELGTLDIRQGASVELVTAGGSVLWSAPAGFEGNRAVVKVDRVLTAGAYWVRLLGPDKSLLREYALRVEPR